MIQTNVCFVFRDVRKREFEYEKDIGIKITLPLGPKCNG